MSSNREITEQTRALFDASEKGDTIAVSELVKDPRVNLNWHCTESYGATALIAAISNGHADIVRILLDADAEVGALKTPDRNSPLHEAAFRDEPEIMKAILTKIQQKSNQEPVEAFVNLTNQFGNTPLHNAARTGSARCVEYLLQAGANISIKNVNGSIPLHHACYCDSPNLKVVKLLVDAGSNIDAQDEQGYTPLIVAAKKNQTDVIDYLRSRGADTKITNSFGEDALHFATLRENTSAVKLLE